MSITKIDFSIFVIAALICVIGATTVYSAGFDMDLGWSPRFSKQIYSFLMGGAVFLTCMALQPSFFRKWAYFFYFGGISLLGLTLLLGIVGGGARRWLLVGGFTLQPSEFTKLALILVLARIFSGDEIRRNGYRLLELWRPGLAIALPLVLIAIQPDLGTALCHVFIAGGMLYVAGIERKTLIRIIVGGFLTAGGAWPFLMDYQKLRILNFMSPERDPQGTGYHAIQSKIAVGSGGLFGKGFMEGTQTQLRFLPEETTDFIFSVLAEEWGVIGTMALLGLYCLLITRIVTHALRSTERFNMFVLVGIAAMLFTHVVVNIGMATGVLPVVGVTLPLLSYGGSSALAVLTGLGIASCMTKSRGASRV